MAQLLIGIVLVLQSKYIRPEYFTADFSLFPAWPRFDYERALRLFELTMAVLLAPKFLGLIVALNDGADPARLRRRRPARPVVADRDRHFRRAGADHDADPIGRGGADPLRARHRLEPATPRRRLDSLLQPSCAAIAPTPRSGSITLFAAGLISPSLVIWMSPTIAGLILSIPLSWASGQMWIGVGLRRLGLLTTPEETQTPPIVARANALAKELALTGGDDEDGLRAVAGDAAFRQRHEMFLPDAGRHRRGEIDVDEAVAIAKLNDARSVEEACAWLKPGSSSPCSPIAR